MVLYIAMLQAVHHRSETVNATSYLLLPAVLHDEQSCVPLALAKLYPLTS